MVVRSSVGTASEQSEDLVRELVESAARGNAAAFGELYDRYVDTIYRYLYYRLGQVAEAEDLTEQVFLKAWEGIHRFRWRGKPFVAWLYRVARNVLIDYRRARRATDPLEAHRERSHPDDALDHRIAAHDLAAAIQQLTEEQQEVIVLRFLEGLEHAEIAERTGRREGAVRALQLRALRSLRKIVERWER